MARLNDAEFSMMQWPLRRWSQRHIELPLFRRMLARQSVSLEGASVLDVGCGSGAGLEMLERAFAPKRIAGFDLMPEQVRLARQRAPRAELEVGDVTAIPAEADAFDAAFVFAILHHVPAWRTGLREIARVLKRGGVLLVEELSGTAVSAADRFLGTSHPDESRFEWPQFRDGLASAGFEILEERPLAGPLVHAFLARAHGPA